MSEYPTTADGWSVFLQAARAARDTVRGKLVNAEHDLNEAQRAYEQWRESPAVILAAWAPIAARLSAELGTDFTVEHNGGGTFALRGVFAGVTVTVTDWLNSDLSHPEAGTGWWVGFTLPDTRWRGIVESLVGDPFARTADDLIKLVAFAVSGYFRGERYPCRAPSQEGMAMISYDYDGGDE